MESTGEGKRERKGNRRPGGVGRRARRLPGHSHPFEVRRKAVQLCLEEGFPVPQVAREMGVGRSTLTKWIKLYRDQGEAGLQSKVQ
jgi:transposase